MMTTTDQAHAVHKATTRRMYMAFDLGNKQWHITFGDGVRQRQVSIDARDLGALSVQIAKAKKAFGLASSAQVLSCYEAGRDGFWFHRHLEEVEGISNTVVDPASIETNRRGRRPKTDRIDSKKLLRKLIQYHGGDKDVWSALHIPTREQEQERRLMRHRKQLQEEINANTNRIKSLALLHGITLTRITDAAVEPAITRLGPLEQQEIAFGLERLKLARQQLCKLDDQIDQHFKPAASAKAGSPAARKATSKLEPAGPAEQAPAHSQYTRQLERKATALATIKGIGNTAAWRLVTEFFWRDFHNRREVGGAAGLTSTPWNSGNDEREQGISKTGNSCIRDMMVELAWLWITRWQPKSALTLWFNERFAIGKRRRKVGAVAVARKLLIALWRYLEFGVVPEGAVLKPQLEAR